MNTKTKLARYGALAVLFSLPPFALAAEPAADESVVTLDKLEVSDVPLEENILPTVRPIGSVMGDDRNIIDTPRSVTSINKAWLIERNVTNAQDYGQFSPGVYSPSQYGVPATPQIRGDLAETYVNGQRTKFSRNTILPSFNGVEALDIVKGPGSPVYGPQGQGPGGYVNFVTKKPYFDKQHTQISTTLGYLTEARNYFNPEFTLDTGGPINESLAYRFSYLSRYGDGYFLNTNNETQDFFGAITWNATPKLSFDVFVQNYQNQFAAVSGLNRVTQDLIDNGVYIAGPVQENNIFGGPVATNPFFQVLDATKAYRVKLDGSRALVGPDDFVFTQRFQSQLVTTYKIDEDSKIINRSYYEDRSSKEIDYYGYDAYVPNDSSLNNRTEYHGGFTLFGHEQTFITGLDLRYEELTSYQDFSVEPLSPYDLTQPGSTYIYPLYASTGTFGGRPIPGRPGYSATSFPIAGNQNSKVMDTGLFFQQDLKLTERFSTILGFRLDQIHASSQNPDFVGLPAGAQYDATVDVLNPAYFASFVYKTTKASSVYFTYNRVNASSGAAFGGVDATGGEDGLENSVSALSELFEIGAKSTFLDGTLYASVSVFEQTRQRPQLVGPQAEIQDLGLELETVYKPSKALSFNANATFQDAEQFSPFFYQQTSSYLDFYPVGFIVDGQSGTGKGSPNYGGHVPPNGKSIDAPGVPKFLANFYGSYEFASGFGFGAGPQIQGEQNANAEGSLVIPVQIQWDGFIFFRRPTWDIQLSVKNIMNERLYDSIDVTFAGNDLIYQRPLRAYSISARYRF